MSLGTAVSLVTVCHYHRLGNVPWKETCLMPGSGSWGVYDEGVHVVRTAWLMLN